MAAIEKSPGRRRPTAEVREALLAAARAEFGRAGYAGATTAAIARRAETTEAQLFRYFPSKSALFRVAVLDPLDAELVAFTDRTVAAGGDDGVTERQAAAYIDELMRFILNHERTFLSLVATEAYRAGDVEGIGSVDALHAYFERGAAMVRARSTGGDKLPPALMVRVSFATVLACTIFRHWLLPEGMADDAATRNAISRFVIDGLYAAAEPAG